VDNQYTIGDVVIVFWGVTGCAFSIGYAAPFYESFQIGKTSAKNIFDVIERRSEIDTSKNLVGKKLAKNYKTDIEFRNVRFSYPSRPDVPILRGLNLKINSGEIVALVGSSGCGKSTTIQLIQRFYDCKDGVVMLDNHDIRDLNVGWLRAQLGVVGQEPVLFDTSIEENIRMGMPIDQMNQVTMEDIERAALEANAHEFISKLPDKYQTYVGDRGTQLSGGQKQRIAIARALISKPKILLLDEATSALDLQSEHIVQAALDRASQNRTTIIIAHRLSTIINANHIFYIDKGEVIEHGTHQSLMELKGKYYSLVQAQQITNDNQTTTTTATMRPKLIEQMHNNETVMIKRKLSERFSSEISMGMGKTVTPMIDDVVDQDDMKKLKKFSHMRLFRLIWLDRTFFTIAFIMALIYGTSTPIYALIFGEFVDIFARSKDGDYLMTQTLYYTYAFIGLAMGIFICCTTQITLFGIVGEKLTNRLRKMAYSAILDQEIAFFDEANNSAGALCSRLGNDAANVQGATGLRISMMCQAISTLIFSIAMGFYYNWRLSLVSLALMPIVACASMISSSIYSQQASKDGITAEKSSKTAIEVMNSIRTVVSLHKEDYFYNIFNQTLIESYL
ncbi:ABC transporter sub-family B, mitochondrial-like protein, partial [Euroglyphus maynei]